MDPVSFRKSKKWSQTRLAEELGVGSRSYMSELETGKQRWPLRLALRLQMVSEGAVPAASICPEAAELLPDDRQTIALEARP